jgi:hypothetical protein
VEIYVGILIGAVTFSGSIIAFGKLSGRIGGKPLLLPGRHWLNLVGLLVVIYFGRVFLQAHDINAGMLPLLVMTVVALAFGVHMVMAIGGADMPVVVSMLNSYSGWAAAATGFMLSNDLLIVTGALVGSSGAILSYIMCRAMNRNFISVIAGGFGTGGGAPAAAAGAAQPAGEVSPVSAVETAELLREAKSVIIVPGYGMAVAQAQHTVFEITRLLRDRGVKVRFGIHPVAGRMPGHMNVLLAEALRLDPLCVALAQRRVGRRVAAQQLGRDGARLHAHDDAADPAAKQVPEGRHAVRVDQCHVEQGLEQLAHGGQRHAKRTRLGAQQVTVGAFLRRVFGRRAARPLDEVDDRRRNAPELPARRPGGLEVVALRPTALAAGHEREVQRPPHQADHRHPDQFLLQEELQERDAAVEHALQHQDVDPALVVG